MDETPESKLQIEFDGAAFAKEIQGADGAGIKTKYVLLFIGDLQPEDRRTIVDLLAICTNWTRSQLRELSWSDTFGLFNQLIAAVTADSVDPQKPAA